jgi:hypothetical protein
LLRTKRARRFKLVVTRPVAKWQVFMEIAASEKRRNRKPGAFYKRLRGREWQCWRAASLIGAVICMSISEEHSDPIASSDFVPPAQIETSDFGSPGNYYGTIGAIER